MALSTQGIAHQIVSSLITYRKDNLGTINDCKVVLNHLIRKFSEPLEKEGKQRYYRSKNLIENCKVIKEHLFPVNEIMSHLLSIEMNTSKSVLSDNVARYLQDALVIVYVTEAEDQALNDFGYQRKMPKEYLEHEHPLFNDIWARYKSAGIYRNIVSYATYQND